MAPHRGLLYFILLIFLLFDDKSLALAGKCNREPEGKKTPKTVADGRFRIKISGNPDKYVPGEIYTVTLQGTRNQQVAQKFTGFMLSVEPLDGRFSLKGKSTVGSFQLYSDALTKFSDKCPNTITQTSSLPKSEIQVLWTAPIERASGCVVFRAMVVEHRDVWYQDDGPLSRIICEDSQENLDEQPQINDPCCACDEAKYEVTFEAHWSKHTHPKDFPMNPWLTRFSDVIGASHTADYRFWDYGGVSSEGLRQVAERASTRMLETELKAESDHIRTIIKARGISFLNNTGGKTFAVFRVDRHNHLMSLVSMIEPSPDWFVGVSGLELCLRNCTWVENKVLNLYPWDAGTDSGVSYVSPDSPTTPRDIIRRITSSFPNDPRSPFYDPTGAEMKPLARLYLTRQRLYEKSCADIDHVVSTEESVEEKPECRVSEWSEWSQCSASCTRGVKHRERYYINQMQAEIHACERTLNQREPCMGTHPSCQRQDIKMSENPLCATTDWGPWSSCTVTCGRGVRTRSRRYVERQYQKICNSLLTQTEPCEVDEECDIKPPDEQRLPAYCRTTPWSEWGPCSATCGHGIQQRNRYYQFPGQLNEQCNLKMAEQVECQAELADCDLGPEDLKVVCQLEKEVGPCRGYFPRWYFDSVTEECQQFIYSGCRGNRNNFERREDCEEKCSGLKDNTSDGISGLGTRDLIIGWSPSTNAPVTALIGDQTDCEVSAWSKWSSCSVTCGKGWKTKWRKIKIHPRNGGKPCPKKLLKNRKCKEQACGGMDRMKIGDLPTWGEGPVSSSLVYEYNADLLNNNDNSDEEDYPMNTQQQQHHNQQLTKQQGGDCILSTWGPWSPCSQSCGPHAVQQRTRSILSPSWGDGLPCGPRLQRRSCALLPCQR